MIEANHAPEVTIEDGSTSRMITPDSPASWPGTGRYLVPAGFHLREVALGGTCGGGLCSGGACTSPDDAFVRVTSVTPTTDRPSSGMTRDPQTPLPSEMNDETAPPAMK